MTHEVKARVQVKIEEYRCAKTGAETPCTLEGSKTETVAFTDFATHTVNAPTATVNIGYSARGLSLQAVGPGDDIGTRKGHFYSGNVDPANATGSWVSGSEPTPTRGCEEGAWTFTAVSFSTPIK